MKCPYCQYEDTRVGDSRLAVDGTEVKRRRLCPQCNERFTTYERVERRYPSIIKSNGNVEAFDEEKVRRGIMRSLKNLSVETPTIENLVNRVYDNISRIGKEHVKSNIVGEEILRELSAFNDVAYIRFASVYRRFNNVDDFTQELQSLKKKITP